LPPCGFAAGVTLVFPPLLFLAEVVLTATPFAPGLLARVASLKILFSFDAGC